MDTKEHFVLGRFLKEKKDVNLDEESFLKKLIYKVEGGH